MKQILVVRVDSIELVERQTGKKEYEQWSKLVDGLIEPVKVEVPMQDGRLRIRQGYVNEEGLLKGLPLNALATAIYTEFSPLVGTLIVMLHKGDVPSRSFFRLDKEFVS